VLAIRNGNKFVPKKQEKRKKGKKKLQQTPLVTSSGCFFDFLTAGRLRNQRTGSEEPLVSVISQAQRTCSFPGRANKELQISG